MQSILKKISPEYSLEGLKLKFQYFGHLMWRVDTHLRGPWFWERLKAGAERDDIGYDGLQHTRVSCLSPSPGACSNSCPLSWWCHPTILSPVIPFSSHLQSFPASGSFLMSWLFTPSGQSNGALVSVLPVSIQGWFPLGLTGFNDTKWKFWTLDSKFCYCCSCGSCICIVTFLN